MGTIPANKIIHPLSFPRKSAKKSACGVVKTLDFFTYLLEIEGTKVGA
jgi:hypothetical protein